MTRLWRQRVLRLPTAAQQKPKVGYAQPILKPSSCWSGLVWPHAPFSGPTCCQLEQLKIQLLWSTGVVRGNSQSDSNRRSHPQSILLRRWLPWQCGNASPNRSKMERGAGSSALRVEQPAADYRRPGSYLDQVINVAGGPISRRRRACPTRISTWKPPQGRSRDHYLSHRKGRRDSTSEQQQCCDGPRCRRSSRDGCTNFCRCAESSRARIVEGWKHWLGSSTLKRLLRVSCRE